MTRHSLTIETLGICTHFTHGVVSGVPHRVVLPNATQIRSHTLALADQAPVLYYLVPHFPQLEVPGGPELTLPGLLWRGDVVIGARLQVINCADQAIEYLDDDTPKLTDFDPDYTFSDDVVLHGRAACYLDIYGGRVSYRRPQRKGGAGSVRIEMQTDGPPELLVTPLAQWSGVSQPTIRLSLGASSDTVRPLTLKVRNVELWREKPADELLGSFDFLLHYLTARGGIPEAISRPTPGMPAHPPSVTPDRMAGALLELAKLVAAAGDRNVGRPVVNDDDLTSSCAPSQYP